MIFFKVNLITVSILVIAMWAIPATKAARNEDFLRDYCRDFLKKYCNFKDDSSDMRGTVGEKLSAVVQDTTAFKSLLMGLPSSVTVPTGYTLFMANIPNDTPRILLQNLALRYLKFLSPLSGSLGSVPAELFQTFCNQTITDADQYLTQFINPNYFTEQQRNSVWLYSIDQLARYL